MSEDSKLVFKSDQNGDLDNPLRAIIVVNSSDAPEGDMEETMLDGIQTHGEVDSFFDDFDEKVAYPNEEHIKYEVGSDGLVMFVVDSVKLKEEVIAFLDRFDSETGAGRNGRKIKEKGGNVDEKEEREGEKKKGKDAE